METRLEEVSERRRPTWKHSRSHSPIHLVFQPILVALLWLRCMRVRAYCCTCVAYSSRYRCIPEITAYPPIKITQRPRRANVCARMLMGLTLIKSPSKIVADLRYVASQRLEKFSRQLRISDIFLATSLVRACFFVEFQTTKFMKKKKKKIHCRHDSWL